MCSASEEETIKSIQSSLRHPMVSLSQDNVVKKLEQYSLTVYCNPNQVIFGKHVRIDLDRENAYAFIPLPCVVYSFVKDKDPELAKMVHFSSIKSVVDKHWDTSVNKAEVTAGFTFYQKHLDDSYDTKRFDPRDDVCTDCM